MNKNLILAIVGGLVMVAIIVGIVIGVSGDDRTEQASSSDQSSQTQTTTENSNTNGLANEIETNAGPYKATVTVSDSTGVLSTATVEIESATRARTTVESSDGIAELILYDGDVYILDTTTGEWLKLPADQTAGLGTDLSETYNLDNPRFGTLFDNATPTGTESCSLGTCDVYQATDPTTGSTATLKIDQSSKRIVEIDGFDDGSGGNVRIVYAYDPNISISPPANVTELNFPLTP